MSNDDTSNNPNKVDPHEGSTSGPPGEAMRVPGDDAGRAAKWPRQSPSQSRMAGWLGSAAADLLGPGLVMATQDQGYAAALNGEHVDACPWRYAETDRDVALRQMWIRGYSAGRTDLRAARDPDRPSP